jgi:hypothetical protein
MKRVLEARLVRLEGIEPPCVLLLPQGEKPEELVIDFSRSGHSRIPKNVPTTYRLEPSSANDPEPLYRELFDE